MDEELGRAAIVYAAVNDVLLWFAIIALLTIAEISNNRVATEALGLHYLISALSPAQSCRRR